MIDLLEKENILQEDIYQIIENQLEESINLDFKAADSLGKHDKKKIELAKDVCSFANSAGGYLIYGINEKNHKAESLSFIDGSVFTKEWIEQIIQTRIQRKIEDLKIIPIRFDGDLKKSVYVIKIPESFSAPHMTSDKRFYKRYNFESVQMEEYEIRNLYNRKGKAVLEIARVSTYGKIDTREINEERVNFSTVIFEIENISNSIEKDYKLLVSFNSNFHSISWDPLRQNKNIVRSIDKNGKICISIFSISPIYPEEILTIGQFELGFSEKSKTTEDNICMLDVKLMYTNGSDFGSFNLEKW